MAAPKRTRNPRPHNIAVTLRYGVPAFMAREAEREGMAGAALTRELLPALGINCRRAPVTEATQQHAAAFLDTAIIRRRADDWAAIEQAGQMIPSAPRSDAVSDEGRCPRDSVEVLIALSVAALAAIGAFLGYESAMEAP